MKTTTFLVCFSLVLSLSACLKTRAQLKGDEESPPTANSDGSIPNPVKDVQPPGGYAVDEIKSEMTRMNGRIEDLERAQKDQAGAANATQSEAAKKLDERVAQLEKSQADMIEQLKKIQEEGPAGDPSELFDKAKAKFDSDDFEGAIDLLNQYLKSAKAKNVEGATFMRAEANYKLKNYKQAIVDYSKFPEKFTKSKKMPEALYKIGLSFESLGMNDDAKGFFQELVDKFPKSPQAKKIRPKLK